jgi:hypothetical protein
MQLDVFQLLLVMYGKHGCVFFTHASNFILAMLPVDVFKKCFL